MNHENFFKTLRAYHTTPIAETHFVLCALFRDSRFSYELHDARKKPFTPESFVYQSEAYENWDTAECRQTIIDDIYGQCEEMGRLNPRMQQAPPEKSAAGEAAERAAKKLAEQTERVERDALTNILRALVKLLLLPSPQRRLAAERELNLFELALNFRNRDKKFRPHNGFSARLDERAVFEINVAPVVPDTRFLGNGSVWETKQAGVGATLLVEFTPPLYQDGSSTPIEEAFVTTAHPELRNGCKRVRLTDNKLMGLLKELFVQCEENQLLSGRVFDLFV